MQATIAKTIIIEWKKMISYINYKIWIDFSLNEGYINCQIYHVNIS